MYSNDAYPGQISIFRNCSLCITDLEFPGLLHEMLKHWYCLQICYVVSFIPVLEFPHTLSAFTFFGIFTAVIVRKT